MWLPAEERCCLTSVKTSSWRFDFGTAPESVGWLASITIRMEKMEMNNVMMDDLLLMLCCADRVEKLAFREAIL